MKQLTVRDYMAHFTLILGPIVMFTEVNKFILDPAEDGCS